MKKESFEYQFSADRVNQDFVCTGLDREERPVIKEILECSKYCKSYTGLVREREIGLKRQILSFLTFFCNWLKIPGDLLRQGLFGRSGFRLYRNGRRIAPKTI